VLGGPALVREGRGSWAEQGGPHGCASVEVAAAPYCSGLRL
jgi:hypothetical protein